MKQLKKEWFLKIKHWRKNDLKNEKQITFKNEANEKKRMILKKLRNIKRMIKNNEAMKNE